MPVEILVIYRFLSSRYSAETAKFISCRASIPKALSGINGQCFNRDFTLHRHVIHSTHAPFKPLWCFHSCYMENEPDTTAVLEKEKKNNLVCSYYHHWFRKAGIYPFQNFGILSKAEYRDSLCPCGMLSLYTVTHILTWKRSELGGIEEEAPSPLWQQTFNRKTSGHCSLK